MPRKKKELPTQAPEPKILDSSLEEILADRFSRYSKYIIQERALPDARDGLKPVQRRILWAMEEDGNTWNHPYRKSARTVGNVIGNYHPHGDSSVYEAIVRLSQDWKSALPLIDMQGNNGSIDDDPPAAMRYTEARLSKISEYLLEDIDKETVEWSPNFSDEKLEPTVLPARYPNLLTSGITGIAAGYATSIPPHNFNEVLEACIYRIDHPECTLDELMHFVKGPDFPTGALIMGTEGIRQALETGRGKVCVRSKAEIVEGKTINQIVITEIPYEVVKGAMVKKMDEIRLAGKIGGLLDVRDESDRKGLRIVCDLKKEANAQAILNYLYKNTDLQTYYHYNVIAIVNQTPRQLGLAAMLDAFLAHREDVIIHRTQFDLKKKQERLHIVEGLIRAVSILDEIIALIRRSSGKADSRQRLEQTFGFSSAQAEAIVTMQLYRLSNTDILALEKEAKDLAKNIAGLKGILEKPRKRRELMKKELRELNETFVMPRRSKILDETHEIVVDDRDMIVEEQVVAVVSGEGYFKRVSMRSFASSAGSAGGLKEGDRYVFNSPVSTLDTLLFFTDKGRTGQIPVYQLEEKKWKDLGSHYSGQFKPESGERIVAVFAERDLAVHTDLILAASSGQIRRIHREELAGKAKGRLSALMNLGSEDSLRFVVPSRHDEDELLLISRNGLSFRLATNDIPLSKGRGKGVRSMNLESEDCLQMVQVADKPFVILENESGQFKKLAVDQIPLLGRPAKGVRLFKDVKSRPAHILSAIQAEGSSTLAFENPELPALESSALPRKDFASLWLRTPVLDEPSPFEQANLRLKSGTRTSPQAAASQLTLFPQEEVDQSPTGKTASSSSK